MSNPFPQLGLGVAWRPALALDIERYSRLGFVEIMAEDFGPGCSIPAAVRRLQERGIPVVPHGVTLSIGGAEAPEPARLQALGRLANRLTAPLVSEHLAFVRADGLEAGHLLPLPRTRTCLEIVAANLRAAQAALPVPLAVENVATLFEWPDAEMDEATFLAEVLEAADAGLLLDVENIYANTRNNGGDPLDYFDRLPLQRLAYVHVGGGVERQGRYHDTHAHAVPQPVLDLFEELCARIEVPGVLLERDDDFPSAEEFAAEMDAIATAVDRGTRRRIREQMPCARERIE